MRSIARFAAVDNSLEPPTAADTAAVVGTLAHTPTVVGTPTEAVARDTPGAAVVDTLGNTLVAT
jgi:hypothetical protein